MLFRHRAADWGWTEKVTNDALAIGTVYFIVIRFYGDGGRITYYINGYDVASAVIAVCARACGLRFRVVVDEVSLSMPQGNMIPEPNNGYSLYSTLPWTLGYDGVSTGAVTYVIDELVWHKRARDNGEVGVVICPRCRPLL